MATYRFTTTTTTPPGDVLNFFADMTHAVDWDPSVAGVERLDQGSVDLGSLFRVTLRSFGRDVVLTYCIDELVAARRLVLYASTSSFVSRDTVTLSALSDTTTLVTYHARLSGRGLTRCLEPLFFVLIQRFGRHAARRLRATYFS